MKSIINYIKESVDNSQKIYVNAIVLCEETDEILILRRANYMRKFRSKWGFPGGSLDINKDKTNKDGAIRELFEETGIKLSWTESHKAEKYKTITNEDNSISEYWLIKLKDKPKEIKLSKEHSSYEWFTHKSKINYSMWMPDVFQIIQEIL